MKALISFDDTKFVGKDKDLINKFIKFLQTEFPLKDEVVVMFMGQRSGKMSTGARTNNSEIKVLAKDRLNRDIMRTLAHEWVHEHQRKILNREHGPDIGGVNEDEANAFAGQLVKKFEKKYPELEPKMYEMKSIHSKLNLLSEQILITEKHSIEKNIISEMKKIGIEKLPYSYSSLQRFIDSKTMDVHYNKHYKGYVEKLNKSLEGQKKDLDLEEIVRTISKFDDKVRNNAGGAFNHALFWKMLSPKKQLPKGEILKKITNDFGNIKKMKDEFNEVAKDRFGSGWAWLYLAKDGKLKIMSTPNQDNPLMNIIKGGGYPLLGLDVWEHAYYLKYQNKRDEYIKKFWDVVNWEFVEDIYLSKLKKNKKTITESESDTEKKKSEISTKYNYGSIGLFEKGSTKKFFFNSVEPIEDLSPVENKIKLVGSEGDFEFDGNDVKIDLLNNRISVNKEVLLNNYPNFKPSNKKNLLKVSGFSPSDVRKSLKIAFPNNWFDEDDVFSAGLRDIYTIGEKIEEPDETWSIMNYFDTKTEVVQLIYEKYLRESKTNTNIGNPISWMANLFQNDTQFVQQLVEKQWSSLKDGVEREKRAVNMFLSKLGDVEVIYYPYGSKMDRYHGVDVTIDGVNYQIKPLDGMKKTEDGNYYVYTYGMQDYQSKNKVDKIAFASKNKVVVINNKDYTVYGTKKVMFTQEPEIF